jgi:thymidylate synthase (FAD)
VIIVDPSYEILTDLSEENVMEMLKHIERVARVCYKSEDKITEDGESAKKILKTLMTKQHFSVLEHSQLAVKFIVDRGISHEIVRHRLSSFAQESTRYCNYSNDKFDNQITVVSPARLLVYNDRAYRKWTQAMIDAENYYFDILAEGVKPELARDVLPNSVKTELIVTTNFREWRHILDLRTSPMAHPQMRQVMVPLLEELQEKIPIIFNDIAPEENWEEIDKVRLMPD